jgi:3-hydroxyacyl-[acyl-carrier-protein] dehydratase
MPPELHLNPREIDLSRIVADQEQIQQYNPQRFEMMMLTAIVYLDTTRHLIVGYKDMHADEFWARGHLPGYPLFPGVLQCEAAAQLCSYYIVSQNIFQQDFVALGGLENARFRLPIRPGDRLVLVAKSVKLHRRQTIFNVQGFLGDKMAFHVDVVGMPFTLTKD